MENDYWKKQQEKQATYIRLREFGDIIINSCFISTGGGGYEGAVLTFDRIATQSAFFESVKIQMINCKSPTIELSFEKFKEHFSGWQEMTQSDFCKLVYDLWEKAPIPEGGNSFYKHIK